MFVSKLHKICEIVEKMKTDVDRLLLFSKMKKSSILAKYTENVFLLFKPNKIFRTERVGKRWK